MEGPDILVVRAFSLSGALPAWRLFERVRVLIFLSLLQVMLRSMRCSIFSREDGA